MRAGAGAVAPIASCIWNLVAGHQLAVDHVVDGDAALHHGRAQLVDGLVLSRRALRLVALHSAWVWDHEGASKARVEIAELKFWGAKVLHDVVDRAIQVHGALGWTMDLPLAKMYVSARQFRIADGADEVHKSFVATKKAKAYKPVDDWPSMHIPTRKEAARARFAAPGLFSSHGMSSTRPNALRLSM